MTSSSLRAKIHDNLTANTIAQWLDQQKTDPKRDSEHQPDTIYLKDVFCIHNDAIPSSTDDTATVDQLSMLSSSTLALLIPSLISWLAGQDMYRKPPAVNSLLQLLRNRLSAGSQASSQTDTNRVIDSLNAILFSHTVTETDKTLKFIVVDDILPYLPKRTLEPFRPALNHLVLQRAGIEASWNDWFSRAIDDCLKLLDAERPWTPRDKYDYFAVRTFTHPDLVPPGLEGDNIIKESMEGLLEWVQDLNWPVAGDVMEFLRDHIALALPTIEKLLTEKLDDDSDDEWKMHLLGILEQQMSRETWEKEEWDGLRGIVVRIARMPTKVERESGSWEAAMDVLAEMRGEG